MFIWITSFEPFWLISEVIKNMVVVFIRNNCMRMVFVYFAFWGLQEEFSTLPCSPCSPCSTSLFWLLLYHISFWWGTKKNQDKNEQYIFVFEKFPVITSLILFEGESVYIRGVLKACLSKHRCQKRSDWMFTINHPITVNITNKCSFT